jgi:predicted TIM-barrel enzyme
MVARERQKSADHFLPMSVFTDWPTEEHADGFLLSPVMKGLPVGQASPLALGPTRNANQHTGIEVVANWPSDGLFDAPFLKELSGKGLGFEREVTVIEEAVASGFKAIATIFTIERGVTMQEARADRLLLHPPLVDGRIMRVEDAITWAEPKLVELGAAGARGSLYVEEPARARRPGPTIFSG